MPEVFVGKAEAVLRNILISLVRDRRKNAHHEGLEIEHPKGPFRFLTGGKALWVTSREARRPICGTP